MRVIAETRTTFRSEAEAAVTDLGAKSDEIMARQPGFVSLRRYRRIGHPEVLVLVEWESLAAHQACQAAPDWAPLWPTWQKLQGSGEISFEMRLLGAVEP